MRYAWHFLNVDRASPYCSERWYTSASNVANWGYLADSGGTGPIAASCPCNKSAAPFKMPKSACRCAKASTRAASEPTSAAASAIVGRNRIAPIKEAADQRRLPITATNIKALMLDKIMVSLACRAVRFTSDKHVAS